MAENPGQALATANEQVTDEFMEKLDKDPTLIQTLKPDIRNQVMRRAAGQAPEEEIKPIDPTPKSTTGSEETVKPDSDNQDGESKKVEEKKVLDTPKPVLSEDAQRYKEEHQKNSDEANKWKQKADAAKSKLAREKEEFDKANTTETKDVVDPLDQNHQNDVVARLDKNEKLLQYYMERDKQRDQGVIDDAEANSARLANEQVNRDIGKAQKDFKIETKEPFETMDRSLNDFYGKVAEQVPGEQPAAEKLKIAIDTYNDDSSLRERVKAAGFTPPNYSEEDWKSFGIVKTIVDKKNQHGGTIRGHFLELMETTGVLQDHHNRELKGAAVEAANKTVDAIHKGQNGISTLNPSDGGNAPDANAIDTMRNELTAFNAKSKAGLTLTTLERARMPVLMKAIASAGEA